MTSDKMHIKTFKLITDTINKFVSRENEKIRAAKRISKTAVYDWKCIYDAMKKYDLTEGQALVAAVASEEYSCSIDHYIEIRNKRRIGA